MITNRFTLKLQYLSAVTCLEYCRYDVKRNTINKYISNMYLIALTLSRFADGRALQMDTHSEPVDQRHLTASPSSSTTGIRIVVRHPY